MRPIYFKLSFLLIFFFAAAGKANAQQRDTIRVTIRDAEQQFLKNNLALMVQHYNINSAEAQVLTARLFPNPDFVFTNGIINDTHDAYLNHTFSISQLINTAGKRNRNIQLTKIAVEQARYQFFDLLRTLKFTLRNYFYNIYFQEASQKVYKKEIDALTKTDSAYTQQVQKGNIAQKELLRIEAQLYSLQTEFNNLEVNIDTLQAQFKLLIRANPNSYIVPDIDLNHLLRQEVLKVAYQALADSAVANRSDLKYAKTTIDYNNTNLKLQKAIAVPDVNFSMEYDKFSSYNPNYIGSGIEFNLPIFNRNQGNIKQAKIAIEQSKVTYESQRDQLNSDLSVAFKEAIRYERQLAGINKSFSPAFTHLIDEVLKNYQRRNISLLEFLDYYDAYKNNVLQYNSTLFSRISSLEQLNYVTATHFYN